MKPVRLPLDTLDSSPSKLEIDDSFKHLLGHEKEILRRRLDLPIGEINYIDLYRYATRNDRIILAIAGLSAIIGGALLPLMTILFGGLAGTFQSFTLGNISQINFASELAKFSVFFIYLAIGKFMVVYIAMVGFLYAGEHISSKIREQFLAAFLRQNIAFFEELGTGEITTQITACTNLIQKGLSEKVGLTLSAIATFVTIFVIGFTRYWKLTLILSSTVEAIVITLSTMGTLTGKLSKTYITNFAESGCRRSHQFHPKCDRIPYPGEAGTTIRHISYKGRESCIETQVH